MDMDTGLTDKCRLIVVAVASDLAVPLPLRLANQTAALIGQHLAGKAGCLEPFELQRPAGVACPTVSCAISTRALNVIAAHETAATPKMAGRPVLLFLTQGQTALAG